jgi:uncharacterized protein YndB with AHSA1/START domain
MSTTESKSKTPADDLLVRKSVFVKTSPERAFDVFTKDLFQWWPIDHHIVKEPVSTTIEPRVGGRLYETGKSGEVCDWGKVLAFDRPRRFAFVWQLGTDFHYDPKLHTEVDVTFTPENGGTRVDLEHRNLRAYGADAEKMKQVFEAPNAWQGILEHFEKFTSAA